MIQVFKKIWNFSGSEKGKIRSSIVWGFINAIFYALQLGGIFVVLEAVVSGNRDSGTALTALGVMAVSIIGQIVTLYTTFTVNSFFLEQTKDGVVSKIERLIKDDVRKKAAAI